MTITLFSATGAHLPVPSDREVAATMAAARSEATRRAYRTQWRLFTSWANEVGSQSLPAAPATVARYLVARYLVARYLVARYLVARYLVARYLVARYLVARHQAGASVATVRASATAVGQAHRVAGHPSPVADEAVRLTIAGIARTDHRTQAQAAPLDAAALDAIMAAAKRPRVGRHGVLESADYAARRGAVDIALALLVSDAGLRRSEVAELTWCDVVRWPDGSGRVTVRRSKTDAVGSGAVVYATPRAMAALDAIRRDDEDGEELVFGGLGAAQLSRRIAAAAAHAGLEGDYSGHSGRVEMAVRMATHGAPTAAAMRQGRWRSPAMVARYTKAVEAGAAGKWL